MNTVPFDFTALKKVNQRLGKSSFPLQDNLIGLETKHESSVSNSGAICCMSGEHAYLFTEER